MKRPAARKTVACPPEIPLGTPVIIEDIGLRLCEDRGGKIKGNRLDVYIPRRKAALKFGVRRDVGVIVVEG